MLDVSQSFKVISALKLWNPLTRMTIFIECRNDSLEDSMNIRISFGKMKKDALQVQSTMYCRSMNSLGLGPIKLCWYT